MHGTPHAWRLLQHTIRSGRSNITKAASLEWGIEHEKAARASYELERGLKVRQVGFVIADNPNYGCSPDGMVLPRGVLEIKCPWNPRNHLTVVINRTLPQQYRAQVQGQLWVCERDWCDFVSFDPRQKEKQRMVIVRVFRDEAYIARLAEQCALFMELYHSKKNPVQHHRRVPRLF